ncbi:MAG: hypothetical protein HQK89_01885 [Nitrospirae bacterium]|nr:hypothetical protein [Nitrospirota bacterium]
MTSGITHYGTSCRYLFDRLLNGMFMPLLPDELFCMFGTDNHVHRRYHEQGKECTDGKPVIIGRSMLIPNGIQKSKGQKINTKSTNKGTKKYRIA